MICGCGYQWQMDCMRCTKPERRAVPPGAVGSDDYVMVPAGANGPAGPTTQLQARRLDQDQMCQIVAWSDPPDDVLKTPLFEAIWQAIKTWDINVPGAYGGYCGATGNHVYAIYRAVEALAPPDARPLDNYERSMQERIAMLERMVQRDAGILLEYDEQVAALEADLENSRLTLVMVQAANLDLVLKLADMRATFGDPAPADLPPPVLRPDGTLAPEPKPLPVLKTATPSRRIGG